MTTIDQTSIEYLASFYEDEHRVLSSKEIQDQILLALKHRGLMEVDEDGMGSYLKKKPLIQKLYQWLPNIKQTSIRTQLNNLFKDDVLKISVKYKSKPYVIKGRSYNLRWSGVKHLHTKSGMLMDILMGDDPQKRLKYITDAVKSGYKFDLDV